MTSTISYATDDAPVELGTPDRRRRGTLSPAVALRWTWLPLGISLGANLVFFVTWWLPEFSRYPGHAWLLTQLTPLASKGLTSQGEAVVAAQVGRSGLVAALLLVTAVPLPFLARSRRWSLRVVVPMAITYLGAIGLVITLLGLLSRGTLGGSLVGLLLMAAWVAAAAVTTWRALRVRVEALPRRPRRVLWLVAGFAVLNPGPLALGRAVFSPELTEAARAQTDGDPALRFAALNTPATVALYLAGVGLALLVWAAYMALPPVRDVTVPWVRRSTARYTPFVIRLVILGAAIVFAVTTGAGGAVVGQARAHQLELGSPATDLPQRCGAWSITPSSQPGQPGQPEKAAMTLVIRGSGCRSAATFRGYHLGTTRDLGLRLSPVSARTPEDRKIEGRVVAARYGSVVVVAGSGRLDLKPDALRGLRLSDGKQLWSYRCDDDQSFMVRFAGSSDGDAPEAGRDTGFGEKTAVVVRCANGTVGLDAATGRLKR